MKPMPNIPTQPLPFEQRLKLVQAEIASRAGQQPANTRTAARARLWRNWITQNVLNTPATKPQPINCDLYHFRRNQAVEVQL